VIVIFSNSGREKEGEGGVGWLGNTTQSESGGTSQRDEKEGCSEGRAGKQNKKPLAPFDGK